MRGLTLIETLFALAIFALLMGGVSALILAGLRTQNFTFQQAQALQEARSGVEQMVREAREAREAADGSYLIKKAEDYEFVFYSDMDKDDEIERVRYFIKPEGGAGGSETKTCVSFSDGGSCSVSFSWFLSGTLDSATLEVSAEGDLDHASQETADVSADGVPLDTLCQGGGACGQCAGGYEDLSSFDVTSEAADDTLQAVADAASNVGAFCDWEDPDHSLKARFTLSWEEEAVPSDTALFQKGVADPVGWPPEYPRDEETSVISENVQNEVRAVPVFTYYDKDGILLVDPQERIDETRRVHVSLIVNVDPSRAPDDFTVESDMRLRNLGL